MVKIFAGIVGSLLLITCSGIPYKNHPPSTSKPHIILILVDDLGKEWISCYGAGDIKTPHIDALARSGTRFDHVYSMPQCTPTRVTLLTGQYPFRHGWVNHWDVPRWGGGAHFDETKNPSLGIEMKKSGYRTCIAGKWQIDDFRVEPDAMTKNGFDEYCMWTGYETGVPASSERYQNPYLYTSQRARTYAGKFGPDIFKDFIIEFIRNNKTQPMFIYYPMVLTHTPFVNTPDKTASDDLGKHQAMVTYADKITGEIMAVLNRENIR
ncbi:MAG: sulfatase-like hydrolase/transferase, partial [Saprospiraceae bacterium]|nr:sulfatase-like hydrolase/transferase [Saprospiraceae bacterium]